jgi:shikimate kinase
VWLDLPLTDLIPRIPLDGRRPLAANRAQLERLYALRLDAYRLAHVRVPATGNMSVSALVDDVIAALQQRSLVNLPSSKI